jgi:hypothetical protein
MLIWKRALKKKNDLASLALPEDGEEMAADVSMRGGGRVVCFV